MNAQKNSGDFNQRLDHPCLWTCEGFKPGRCLLKGSAMGDPGVGLNGAIGNQTDDTREIFGKGVSTGLESDFSSMKGRMKKLNSFR